MRRRMEQGWQRWSQSRASVYGTALLALLLSAPALGQPLQMDDWILKSLVMEGAGIFEVFHLHPATTDRLRELLPWWVSPQLEIRFLRPLTTLTHTLEFSLWPDAVWAMRLVNGLIYASLVAVAAATYRMLFSTTTLAAAAALMFAIDEAHAMAVGWISSRNTLLAALLGLLALFCHIRGRHQQRRGWLWMSPVWLALALASGEIAVSAAAYFVAYAWVMEEGRWAKRLQTIAPQAGVVLAWLSIYITMGFGARHAGWYRDIRAAPLAAIANGLLDLPLWLFGQFGLSGVLAAATMPPLVPRLLALVLVLPLLWLLWPSLKTSRLARFFALGFALSLPPLMLTHPQTRVLIASGFGAFGWVACFFGDALQSATARARWGSRLFRGLHVYLAALLFVPSLNTLARSETRMRSSADAMTEHRDKELIVLRHPYDMAEFYASWYLRAQPDRAPRSTSMHQLYAGFSALDVTRVDRTTLEIFAPEGWGNVAFSRLMTSKEAFPSPGESRSFEGMHATVLESNEEGPPTRVRFRFPTDLDAARYQWLTWKNARPARWTPPSVGSTVSLPTLRMFQSEPQS